MIIYCGLVAAVLYVCERVLKYFAVLRFFRNSDPLPSSPPNCLSILQPILSGDPALEHTLAHNLGVAFGCPVEFLWLIDDDDDEANRICNALVRTHADIPIRIFHLARGNPRQSPKMLKLQFGLTQAMGDVIAVLDDDTMLPADGIMGGLGWLEEESVGLAFGLPYYVAYDNIPESFVSVFVDSNSLLTYVPYTLLTDPFTINGMFYVMRRDRLEQVNKFDGLESILADDFAVAQRVCSSGLRLAQSRVRHAIYTHVLTWSDYFKLIRRWLVFPRESLLRNLPLSDQIVAYTLGLLPAVIPLLVLICALLTNAGILWIALAVCLLLHLAIVWHLNAKFLSHAIPARKYWIVPVIQLLIPVQLIVALMLPQRIVWRGHEIQVERGGTFEITRARRGTLLGGNDRET